MARIIGWDSFTSTRYLPRRQPMGGPNTFLLVGGVKDSAWTNAMLGSIEIKNPLLAVFGAGFFVWLSKGVAIEGQLVSS
jgi:hypothetical protein